MLTHCCCSRIFRQWRWRSCRLERKQRGPSSRIVEWAAPSNPSNRKCRRPRITARARLGGPVSVRVVLWESRMSLWVVWAVTGYWEQRGQGGCLSLGLVVSLWKGFWLCFPVDRSSSSTSTNSLFREKKRGDCFLLGIYCILGAILVTLYFILIQLGKLRFRANWPKVT